MQQTKEKCITVIIVEDFKLTRVGLRCALNSNPDIEVVSEAEDAITGLKSIEKYHPDVVLMDLGLPQMNGIEAIISFCDSIQNCLQKIVHFSGLRNTLAINWQYSPAV